MLVVLFHKQIIMNLKQMDFFQNLNLVVIEIFVNFKKKINQSIFFPFVENVVYSDYLTGKTMADFIGVNGLEKNIVEAIMNFSYHLTLGDLDAAFKAIKIIKKYEHKERFF